MLLDMDEDSDSNNYAQKIYSLGENPTTNHGNLKLDQITSDLAQI